VTLSITVLGSSGTYPGPGEACSGYLLRSSSTTVWLDCGTGTLANLQRHVSLADVDGIVCSHSHPDHWLELPVAVNALRYGVGRPKARLPLYWTAQTAKRFEAVSGGPPEPTLAAEVIDERSSVRIGDIDLSFSRTDHPVETLAVRADAGGRSIAYTADTGNGWELASLGSGIDVAVVEATLDEDEADVVQHLTGSQAGAQAARAGVARLVLTHLPPGSDPDARTAAAAAAFDGPIAVARTDERY
jgi:ribonuclease BN (tRNA processing enzyme)